MNQKEIGCGVHYRSITDYKFYKNKMTLNFSDLKNTIEFGSETNNFSRFMCKTK